MAVVCWSRVALAACLTLWPLSALAQGAADLPRLAREEGASVALSEVDRRLRHTPQDPELRLWRARLLYWLGRVDASHAAIEPLSRERPDDAEVCALQAQVRHARGDETEALGLYLKLEARRQLDDELRPRLVDLLLAHGTAARAVAVLGEAPRLDESQARRWAQLTHPWFTGLGTSQTVVRNEVWPRLMADIGQRWSGRWTWLVGLTGEQRFGGLDRQRAWSAAAESWLTLGGWALWLHLEGSPSRSFLPTVDGRLDVQHAVAGPLSAGLLVRAARYDPSLAPTASAAWSLAPRLVWSPGQWTLEPGYQLTMQQAGTGSTQTLHAGVLKTRWQVRPATALLAWLVAGQDPTWLERGLTPGRGLTLLAGVDHGWSPRWSTRLSLSRLQPLGTGDPWTELGLTLRARL